jgi:hypothetical protein
MDTALLLTQVVAQLMCATQHVAWLLCKGCESCAPVDVHVEIALQHAQRLLGTHKAGEPPLPPCACWLDIVQVNAR